MNKPIKATWAVYQWTVAGMPTRTEEEQARILNEVCRPCEFYKTGKCDSCGCYLRQKIKMATESCPLNPPKWTATA